MPKKLSTATMHLARMIDHTELRLGAPHQDIENAARIAVDYHCAACCVRPQHAGWIAGILGDTETKLCVAVGLQNLSSKYDRTKDSPQEGLKKYDVPVEDKLREIDTAVDLAQNSARKLELEIDFVINLFEFLRGRKSAVEEELERIIEHCRAAGLPIVTKMVGENYWLNDEQKIELYSMGREAGVDYFKTSSGFTMYGATQEDVRLMKEIAQGQVRIKAAGGINNFNYHFFLDEGIDRIGTSKAKEIIDYFIEEIS